MTQFVRTTGVSTETTPIASTFSAMFSATFLVAFHVKRSGSFGSLLWCAP